ncbi:hypothetical protein LshimejAT787_1800070 [Lyophyllum shimeji]|uniref:Uncharacterized protein n=1 Tax=Lyophyllum shimeji TaxID=47721 RepID=A0A9P3PX68_LYOSH|nr:hypothetical protein LshimejAT787_1800070 [Lyophyllum shimeji]
MEGSVPNATPEAMEQEVQRYSTFPLYPTAFILACNVVPEITGETSDIQSHFQTSSVSAGGSVGHGAFTVSSQSAHRHILRFLLRGDG